MSVISFIFGMVKAILGLGVGVSLLCIGLWNIHDYNFNRHGTKESLKMYVLKALPYYIVCAYSLEVIVSQCKYLVTLITIFF